MIRLDTVKLKIPIHCVDRIDKRNPLIDIIPKSIKKPSRIEIDGIPEYGMNKTFISESDVVLGISAKTLTDNYLDGISLRNITQVFDTINRVAPITFNVNDAIQNATILSCDNTENVKPSFDLKTVRDCMMLSRTNPKFKTTQYNGRSLGIEINGSIRSEKRRIIGYSKEAELLKKKGNRFLKSCKDSTKLFESSKGVWRMETNNTSFKSMRKRFGVADTMLLSILDADKKPIYEMYRDVTMEQKQLDLFGELHDGKWSKVQKLHGQINIANMFSRDIDLIVIYMKQYYKGDHYKYKKEYQQIIDELNRQDAITTNPKLNKIESISTELLNLLKAA